MQMPHSIMEMHAHASLVRGLRTVDLPGRGVPLSSGGGGYIPSDRPARWQEPH